MSLLPTVKSNGTAARTERSCADMLPTVMKLARAASAIAVIRFMAISPFEAQSFECVFWNSSQWSPDCFLIASLRRICPWRLLLHPDIEHAPGQIPPAGWEFHDSCYRTVLSIR